MSIPYTPDLAALLLSKMTDEQLDRVTPHSFQPCWAVKPLSADVGRQLIDAERSMRRQRQA